VELRNLYFHQILFVDGCLLGCDAVWSCRWLQTFRRNSPEDHHRHHRCEKHKYNLVYQIDNGVGRTCITHEECEKLVQKFNLHRRDHLGNIGIGGMMIKLFLKK
jgi:hypothetical protein